MKIFRKFFECLKINAKFLEGCAIFGTLNLWNFYINYYETFIQKLVGKCKKNTTLSYLLQTYRYETTLNRIINEIIDAKTLVIMGLVYINFKKYGKFYKKLWKILKKFMNFLNAKIIVSKLKSKNFKIWKKFLRMYIFKKNVMKFWRDCNSILNRVFRNFMNISGLFWIKFKLILSKVCENFN